MSKSIATTFVRPCLDCGVTVQVVDTVEQPHECTPDDERRTALARAWWAGYDSAGEGGPS